MLTPIQYELEGYEGLLLSRRAKKDDKGVYACESCKTSLNRNFRSPPKHAIANGFAIGHLPDEIEYTKPGGGTVKVNVPKALTSDVLCAILSPRRPFAFCISYHGGAHKCLRGHVTFFETDLSHVGEAANLFNRPGANPYIYCVLCGRMTKDQKKLARKKAALDTEKLMALLDWYIKKSGHPAYANFVLPTEFPAPTIIEDPENEHNTDKSGEGDVARLETFYVGPSYSFPSNSPQQDTGVFDTNRDFTLAMLSGTAPTMIVSGGNHVNIRDIKLEDVCPIQFPFGVGGPSMRRRNPVSTSECYQHYTELSLSQFMKGDFLLILNNLNNKVKTFESAVTKLKYGGGAMAENFSVIDPEGKVACIRGLCFWLAPSNHVTALELKRAASEVAEGGYAGGDEGKLLRAVSSSCQAIGSSAEAAAYNRRNLFALDDYFGGCAVFLTITKCDETTYQVRIMSEADVIIELPILYDPVGADDKTRAELVKDKKIRQDRRLLYPGACSLVFQVKRLANPFSRDCNFLT